MKILGSLFQVLCDEPIRAFILLFVITVFIRVWLTQFPRIITLCALEIALVCIFKLGAFIGTVIILLTIGIYIAIVNELDNRKK